MENKEKSTPVNEKSKNQQEEKEKRLAKALRENLLKRKSQQKQRINADCDNKSQGDNLKV